MSSTVANEQDTPRLVTLREVAAELGVRTHVVTYAIREAGIEARQWVGNARLFARHQIPVIRDAVNRTDRRGSSHRLNFVDTNRSQHGCI